MESTLSKKLVFLGLCFEAYFGIILLVITILSQFKLGMGLVALWVLFGLSIVAAFAVRKECKTSSGRISEFILWILFGMGTLLCFVFGMPIFLLIRNLFNFLLQKSDGIMIRPEETILLGIIGTGLLAQCIVPIILGIAGVINPVKRINFDFED